jgi:tetratricopeptide (TPR) repeat protein
MNGKRILGVVLVLGLGAGLLDGQQPSPSRGGENPALAANRLKTQERAAMQEDIEIMRRLLNRSLSDAYGASAANFNLRRYMGGPNGAVINGDQVLKYFLEGSGSMGLAPYNERARVNPYKWGDAVRLNPNANTLSGDVLNLTNDTWAEVFYFGGANQRLPLTTEGAYLKGHGVVFTLTMPPHGLIEQEPQKNLAAGYCAKCHESLPNKLVLNEFFQEKDANVKAMAEKPEQPPSAWEQTRREVRGIKEEPKKEPPPPPARKQSLCGPSVVTDAVLRALAENGRHFSHLGPLENLTVVITFRPMNNAGVASADSFWLDLGWSPASRANLGAGIAMGDFDNDGRVDLFVANANGTGNLVLNNGDGTFSTQKPTPDANANNSQAPAKSDQEDAKKAVDKAIEYLKRNQMPGSRDYELLGDLHLKQGRFEEAVKAFEKAIQENPNSVGLRGKYLEALKSHVEAIQKQLEADKPKLDEMRKQLLDAANEYAKALGGKKEEAAPPQPPPPPPLPVKLTISAPKRILDQVGAGKMTFEEFRKSPEVTVEFSQPAASGEKK